MKLTEDNFSCYSSDEELLEGFELDIEIHTRGEARPIMKQILENQDILERLATFSRWEYHVPLCP